MNTVALASRSCTPREQSRNRTKRPRPAAAVLASAGIIGDNICVDYRLTEHARNALQKREISPAWIEKAVTEPEATEADNVDSDLEHRLRHIPEFGNRVLRVIVNDKAEPPRIITAYFDRRANLP